MSRGPGHIQRSILSLIDSDHDGAWTVGDICRHVYAGANRVEKKHRVAVARALRTVALPERWHVSPLSRLGGEYMIYNSCSEESQLKRRWQGGFSHWPFKSFDQGWPHFRDRAKEAAAENQQYYDADELGRIEISIKEAQTRVGHAAMTGSAEFTKLAAADVSRLQARRDELMK